jgi:hypothetical protein
MSLPRPKQGQKVSFWKQYPPQGRPDMGWILTDGDRAQVVMVIGKFGVRTFTTVRHKSDPDLPLNPAWHAEGVWDFHPDEARLNNLEQAVAELQAQVAGYFTAPPSLPEKKKSSGWTEERRQQQRERMQQTLAKRAAKALQEAS